jgi:23S rRNA (adenine2503-C2)-methyltransferase
MDLPLLEQTLRERGEPAFRARQVWEWTARGASGYDAMTNLPLALRAELEAAVPFSTLDVETERESRDGTVKTLFRTSDGHPVEAVLMRYRDGRRSLCLSSQSGCPLTCTFCATGAMAFGRNLTASEILDQALHFRRLTEVDHCVFMGMGEPMLNLDEALSAGTAAAGSRHHAPADDDLDGRLAARPADGSWTRWTSRSGSRSRSTRRTTTCARGSCPSTSGTRSRTSSPSAAGTRRRQGRRVFVEYVMLAGMNDAPGAGARARRAPRPRPLQGEPDPLQPDRHL